MWGFPCGVITLSPNRSTRRAVRLKVTVSSAKEPTANDGRRKRFAEPLRLLRQLLEPDKRSAYLKKTISAILGPLRVMGSFGRYKTTGGRSQVPRGSCSCCGSSNGPLGRAGLQFDNGCARRVERFTTANVSAQANTLVTGVGTTHGKAT
jgi:hypothetical protein